MKNLQVLPTDKSSRLYSFYGILEDLSYGKTFTIVNEDIAKINLHKDLKDYQEKLIKAGWKAENIFITSDEEIKQGDWHLVWLRDKWEVLNYMPSIGYRKECLGKEVCKIILTTDQDLIADGVPAIEDDFLEWFVQNPSCEFARVNDWLDDSGNIAFGGDKRYQLCNHLYNKEIIPKEEETLEKVAKKYSGLAYDRNDYEEKYYNQQGCTKYDAFIEGAKWQAERMYSEEDLEVAFFEGQFGKYSFNDWLEQFKKK